MVDFNKEYAMSIPKEQWVKEHAHLGNTATLQAEWDKLNGKKDRSEQPAAAPIAEVVAEPIAEPEAAAADVIAEPDIAKEEPLTEE